MRLFKLSFLLAVCTCIFTLTAKSQVNSSNTYVPAYTRSDGTYVSGHYKTTPNSTNRDNYTTKPNVNPYTGTNGYIQPDNKPLTSGSTYASPSNYSTPSTYSTPSSSYTPSSYSAPVSTGSRGGQYYINSNGNKTYVKRQY
jgi:hypothetical protein